MNQNKQLLLYLLFDQDNRAVPKEKIGSPRETPNFATVYAANEPSTEHKEGQKEASSCPSGSCTLESRLNVLVCYSEGGTC